MGERDFVMADDPVVKVGHIKGAVSALMEIIGPKPGIGSAQKIGLLDSAITGAVRDEAITIDPAGHDVANKSVLPEFGGPVAFGINDDAGNGCRAVKVFHQSWGKAQAVVGFAEAGIIRVAEKIVNGQAMAIGGEEIAFGIKVQAEWIGLAVSVLLDVGTI